MAPQLEDRYVGIFEEDVKAVIESGQAALVARKYLEGILNTSPESKMVTEAERPRLLVCLRELDDALVKLNLKAVYGEVDALPAAYRDGLTRLIGVDGNARPTVDEVGDMRMLEELVRLSIVQISTDAKNRRRVQCDEVIRWWLVRATFQ